MKKFKYEVSFEGRQPDLESRLEYLGYTLSSFVHQYTLRDSYLITQFGGEVNTFGYNNAPRIVCASKDLFIALAAMVDDTKFYRDESVISTVSILGQFTQGKLYTVSRDCDNGCLVYKDDSESTTNGFSNGDQRALRKATKEEIIAHYSNLNAKPVSTPKYVSGVDPFDAVVKDNAMPKDIHGNELRVGDTVKVLTGTTTTYTCGRISHVRPDMVVIITGLDCAEHFNSKYFKFEIIEPYDNPPLPKSLSLQNNIVFTNYSSAQASATFNASLLKMTQKYLEGSCSSGTGILGASSKVSDLVLITKPSTSKKFLIL